MVSQIKGNPINNVSNFIEAALLQTQCAHRSQFRGKFYSVNLAKREHMTGKHV